MPGFEITTERRKGQTLIVLSGELDIASTPRFEEGIAEVEGDTPGTLVLDLRAVEFIDSTGLRAVIAAAERAKAQGRRFVIVRGGDGVERVFSVTQLDQRLEIVDDPDSIPDE
jgi:anti-sigma B factor antagonist